MKLLVVLLFFSASVCCAETGEANPGKRRTKEERRAARVERQLFRKIGNSYERTPDQRRKERTVMIIAIIGAGIIYNVLNKPE
jgi:hypothetical protein